MLGQLQLGANSRKSAVFLRIMQAAYPYPYYPYAHPQGYSSYYPHPYAQYQSSSHDSTSNPWLSKYNIGFAPIMALFTVAAGVLWWWNFGTSYTGDKAQALVSATTQPQTCAYVTCRSHREVLTAALQGGGILVILSLAVNMIGFSPSFSGVDLSYNHMLLLLLA